MTKTINYPRKDRTWADVCTQDMFEQATASLFAWQQGLGQFGGLHLHPCWQESSVLTRGYQGQGLHLNGPIMAGCRELYERTGEEHWRQMNDDVARNILLLQQPGGGFRHSSAEFEPAYGSEESCPIQQGFAMLDLLEYAAWPHAREDVVAEISAAYKRFWAWFNNYFWRLGNLWLRPLPFDGFCGVTNQDLVILVVLGKAQQLFGCELFDTVGRPVLETFLSSRYYHEEIGLFERGDAANFVERTGYYGIILPMLMHLYEHTNEERILRAHENVAVHLFDAICTGPDGLAHFAWGANTLEDDKTRLAGWTQAPYTVSVYPEVFLVLEEYLKRKPDSGRQQQLDDVRNTFAAYLFADGGMPTSLGAGNKLFQVVPSRQDSIWHYLIHSLGDQIRSPKAVEQPCIHRRCDEVTWKTRRALWAVEENGVRVFTGFRHDSGGIEAGAELLFRGLDIASIEQPDIFESIAF